MNNRANIMYFLEQFCDMAQKESHLQYVQMIQRDILRVVDAVAPADGSGAANVKVVRRVLSGLQQKSVLTSETVAEIEVNLKERDTNPAHLLADMSPSEQNGQAETQATPRGAKSNGVIKVDKRVIEQRIEEDRERNKRLRESMWTVTGDDGDELEKMWEEGSACGSDDHIIAEEEVAERTQAVEVD